MFYSKLLQIFSIFLCVGAFLCANTAPLKVTCITQDFAVIAKAIGGKEVKVESLVKGSRNLHHISPRPSMVFKLKKTDVLIRLGMSQDKWIDGLIQAARNPKLFKGNASYIDASKNIKKLEVPDSQIDGRSGDVHLEGNPHYWLNPLNGIVIAELICERFSLLRPEKAPHFQKNLRLFRDKINSKLPIWRSQLAHLKTQPIYTYHKVWSYFFDAFDLHLTGTLEPVPGIAPSAKHIQNLIKRFQSTSTSKAKGMVITASFYPQKPGRKLAKTLNIPFYSLASNVGEEGIESYDGLFDYLCDKLQP